MPSLTYPDVEHAVEWLTRVFGLVEHIRIGDHRAQLGFGDGAVFVADANHGRCPPSADESVTHSVMVRVEDVNAHYEPFWQPAAAYSVSPPTTRTGSGSSRRPTRPATTGRSPNP
ncbi:MAG: VOC family protein [Acidimicrobiales bacterium]